ncbi:uncharacterized protein BT62DRAFT_983431 [Guyanagaster necrorhizus]|uniref:Uncharacterized protein n=1 Tax=Guyanagaster necrorhizus TaxID=856835 RepID=A0A9P8AM15_9AGAR|nr:uncharacterized protein BT62DRAFT_983431 [Guyanagaster necrorhizus MCA 3950]KAG7439402.1 hypothetical protein BT62DRAFT_983431 [Guyanagaster necrorhizus MCA 3950]
MHTQILFSAKSKNYFDHQSNDTPILNSCYSLWQIAISPLIKLYYHIFTSFQACIHDESLPVLADIIQLTAELTRTASQISTNAFMCQGSTRNILWQLLNHPVFQELNLNKMNSNHIAELGWSGKGSIQGSFSYAQYWMQEDTQVSCYCSSFIISITGSWIVILGTVFTTQPIIHHANDNDHALHFAHVFQSLRLAINNLEKYYKKLGLSDSHSLQTIHFFSDITEYDNDTKVIRFQYLQPLEIDAAWLLASKGKAPALKYCGPISSDGKYWYGSLQMVIMEFLCGQTVAQKYEVSIAETVYKAVPSASFIHRDIHTPNIVIIDSVRDKGERMRIIDFDWTGEQSKIKYLLHISDYIWNTLHVKDYDIITFQHDMTMVDML